jgi:PAS domain S-box-containing protein
MRSAIAGRKQAERGLRHSEERFEQLVSSVRDYAVFLLDRQGNIRTWNAGAERIKGYRPEEIIGQHFSRFYPEEAVASGWPAHELEVAAATGRFEDEGWRVRKDGSRFWANVVITALRDEAGETRGFMKITRDMTERRQAEENQRRLLHEEAARKAAEQYTQEIEKQREQLHVTLTSIGDAVIVTDPDGVVTFLNPAAAALTGWAPQEAVGQPLGQVFRIIHEATREPAEDPVERALQTGEVVSLANGTLLLSRDGREIAIDDSAAPVRGGAGTQGGAVLVFRDVTEARRAEEARLHLAAIVESSDDAIIGLSLDGRILSWNKGAQRLFGYTAEEVVGEPVSLLAPPEHPDEFSSTVGRIRRGEYIEHHETVRVRKDGSRVNVSLTISPLRDSEGRIIGASKIARDITCRKRQEAALRFLAEASKALGELGDPPGPLQKVAGLSVPQFADWCAVDLVEAEGSLRRVALAHGDPSRVELAHELPRRHPPDPLAARGAGTVVRTGKSELVSVISDELLAETVKEPELLRIVRGLGLRSYLAVPLVVRGKVLGVVTFATAESGRHYDAADLAVAEDLAQRAAIAMENANLYQALREEDRRKTEFLALLAHELRNPLAPLRNGLQVLKLARGDAAAAEKTRTMMERQVQLMTRLVDDLLDVSRISRGRIELRKERVELAAVVAGALETCESFIKQRGHELTVSLPDEPVYVDADRTRLAQAIGNLVTNAAKYTDPGGRIWLTVERRGGEAVIAVKDTGVGIPAPMLPRVFDLFTQVDQSSEKAHGGLGVGLTIVKSLVEMHGGCVEARSEGRGMGSEFLIRLPVVLSVVYGPQEEAVGPEDRPAGRHCVLVVDDNVDAAASLALMFKMMGNEVRTAHDGLEGVEAAAAFRPDLILLDIGMPRLNGYEACRRIRGKPSGKNAVIIALTGWGQEDDKARSREAGFDGHLVKPVEPAAFEELLARLKAETG